MVGGYYTWTGGFNDFLVQTPSLAYAPLHAEAHDAAHAAEAHALVSTVGTVVALAGIALAAFLYLGDDSLVSVLTRWLSPLYWLSYGKLFFDQLYYALVVWPLEMLARASYWFDRTVIDGLVNLVGRIPPWIAGGLRPLQSGLVQFYALAMLWGVLVLVLTLLIWPALGAVFK